jgi:hypothetical protein
MLNPKNGRYLILVAVAFAVIMLGSRLITLRFGQVFPDQGAIERQKIAALEGRVEELKAHDAKMADTYEKIEALKEQNAQLKKVAEDAKNVKPEIVHRRVEVPVVKETKTTVERLITIERSATPTPRPLIIIPREQTAQDELDALGGRQETDDEYLERLRQERLKKEGPLRAAAEANRLDWERMAREAEEAARLAESGAGTPKYTKAGASVEDKTPTIVRRGDSEAKARKVFGRPKSVHDYSSFQDWDYGNFKNIRMKNGVIESWTDMPIEP